MTEIINASDTSLKSALKQQEQQQPLKDVQCNNNEKISPSSSGASSPTMTPNSPKMVPQSKLIISNMESVIRSVKKQHVVKKKKRKIVEPEISDISNILTNSLTFISPNVSNSEEKSSLATVANGHDVQLIDTEKCYSPSTSSSKENHSTPTSSSANSPLSSNESDKNGTAIKTKSNHSKENQSTPINATDNTNKNASNQISITKDNACTPSTSKPSTKTASTSATKKSKTKQKPLSTKALKRSNKVSETPPSTSSANNSLPNNNNDTPKKNAFTVMMLARNNVIGSNSSGKLQINDLTPSPNSVGVTEKVKRKVLLEEWADRKGAGKRKLNDIEADACVERKMTKRTKRLKNLLSNKRKKNNSMTDDDNIIESNDSPEIVRNETTKRRRIVKKIVDSSDEDDSIILLDDASNTTTIVETKVSSSIAKKDPQKSSKDFAQVLSSPIKKRDSLFGYFTKLKTPDNKSNNVAETAECVALPNETPTAPIKRLIKTKRGRPKKLPVIDQQPIVDSATSSPAVVVKRECTPPPIATTTNATSIVDEKHERPKRECRKNHPGYLYDIDISPAKVAAKKSVKLAKRRLSGSPLRTSPAKYHRSPIKMIPKSFDRLAPIFMKSIPKPIVDPAIAKARQLFLMSGIPDCMKLEIDKQRAYEDIFCEEIEFFPTISHVQQLEQSSSTNDTTMIINLKDIDDTDDDTFETIINGKFSCGALTKIVKNVTEINDNPSYTNSKHLIKQLKKNDSTFLYNRCYKQLLTKFQNTKNSANNCNIDDDDVDPLTCHLDDNLSIEIIESPSNDSKAATTASAAETMFIEQYKPTSISEILVNSQPVNELKKFLIKWLDNNENRNRNYDSSGDDFTDSQSNSMSMYSKSIVLVGPSGCGKTNAVYAIANELKFKVLEINASNLRTGKKIFKKLHEATQSHQVKSQNNNSQKCDALIDSDDIKLMSSNTENLMDENHQSALILIEDADVVFEKDFGFIDAIQQLITVTKRPVILIANQRNCSHLQRFMCQNLIEFTAANSINISKYLSTLSIVEMCLIPIDECKQLYMFNNCDLRKTLLEMQFFIRSETKQLQTNNNNDNNDKVFMPQNSIVDFYTNDQNVMQKEIISLPLDFTLIREQTTNIFETESMDSILKFYDSITLAEQLNFNAEKIDNNMSKSIAHEITCETIKQYAKLNHIKRLNNEAISSTWKKKSLSMDVLSTNIVASTKRSIYLDIEPCLRTICRTEKLRTQTERRGSRFYHYLRHMKVSGNIAQSFNTNIFDEYSTVFENLDDDLDKFSK